MKKQWYKLCLTACVIGGFVAASAMGADATPNVMGTGAAVAFAKGGIPTPDMGKAVPVPAAPAVFAGNYTAAGIQGVGLRVKTDGTVPSGCALYFTAGSGRSWYYQLPVLSANPADIITATVPFEYSGAWAAAMGTATEENFKADLEDVTGIGVAVVKAGSDAQAYSVSDFMLLGGASYAAGESLYNYMVANGVKNINADDDGDGLSNWGEFLAGTNPKDAASAFVLRIELDQTAQGPVLKWNHIANRKYAVWKASDLSGKYSKVTYQGKDVLDDNAAGNSVPVDTEWPYFYKVEIVQ